MAYTVKPPPMDKNGNWLFPVGDRVQIINTFMPMEITEVLGNHGYRMKDILGSEVGENRGFKVKEIEPFEGLRKSAWHPDQWKGVKEAYPKLLIFNAEKK